LKRDTTGYIVYMMKSHHCMPNFIVFWEEWFLFWKCALLRIFDYLCYSHVDRRMFQFYELFRFL